MKALKIFIILFLTSLLSHGQSSKRYTFLTRINSTHILSNSNDFLKASKGAENYIKSLLGDTIYNDHIKINYKQSNKAKFQVYVGTTFKSKFLENHIFYNIHYYLLDKKDTLSYFDLLVDSNGRPTSYDKDFSFSSPTKLLLYFKNLFPNKFKIDFKKALAIGIQHGFDTKPFLNCVTLNKEGIYWSFSKKFADRTRKFMDINAKTGSIKEFYMPVIEE